MKKSRILSWFALAAATVFSASATAQEEVYFEEKFSGGKINEDVWNVAGSTQIESADGPIYTVQFQDGSSWGGWVYDPKGQMLVDQNRQPVATTKLDGTYTFLSKPVTLKDNCQNILVFNYRYYAYSYTQKKSFGVMVKEEGQEWDTIFRHWNMGDELSISEDGRLFVNLPDNYRGKTVEIGFFLENKDAITFYLFFTDIQFAAWEVNLETEFFAIPRPIYADNNKIGVKFANIGTVDITSITVSTEINGEKKQTEIPLENKLYLTDVLFADLELDTEGFEIGKEYTISVKIDSINGSVPAEIASQTWNFIYSDPADLPTQLPIIEVFTANWCGPCKTMNTYLNPTLEELRKENKINMVKFQQPTDKYAITEGTDRFIYYIDQQLSSGGIPSPIVNAESNLLYWSASSYQGLMNSLKKYCEEEVKTRTLNTLAIKDVNLDRENGKLKFSVEVTSPVSDLSASLVTVVTEGTTTKNRGGNGEKEFHWVAMAMPGGAFGEAFDMKIGENRVFTYEVDLSATNMEEYEDMEIVAFIQNTDTRQIFQSAYFDYMEEDPSSVEELDGMDNVSVYPNPAGEKAIINGLENADIQIFDITGRMIASYKGINGELEIDGSQYKSATYMVRIAQNGKVATRKITFVK